MRYDKKMSLEEHIQTADDLAIVAHHLSKIYDRCQKHYPKTHILMKMLSKISPISIPNKFSAVQSELDKQYHNTISKETFQKYGNVYYELQKRYEMLSNN